MSESKPIGPTLLATVLGCALGGAAVGALGAWATVVSNDSLDLGRDRLIFGLFVACGALALFLLVAGPAHLVLGRHGRPGLGGVAGGALAALVVALGYLAAQTVIGSRAPWRPEVGAVDLALGAVAGLVLLGLLRRPIGALSRPALLGLPLVLLVGGLVCAAAGTGLRGPGHARRSPDVALVARSGATAERVLLIGIDGADWRRMDPLLAAGRMPNLQRLIDAGVRAPFRVDRPTWSPILWTTVATGVSEELHGVRDFTEFELPGMANGMERARYRYGESPLIPRGVLVAPILSACAALGLGHDVPITAHHRKAAALWNVLSDLDVRVGAVNWYATWPSEVVNGFMIADYDPSDVIGERLTLAAESGGNGFTYPVDLLAELEALRPTWWPHPGSAEQCEEILALPIFDGFRDQARAAYGEESGVLVEIGNQYLGDAFAAAVGEFLVREKGVTFLADYLPGVDRISHRALGESEIAMQLIDGYYAAVDGFLAPFVDLLDGRTLIVMVSDHGWEYGESGVIGHERAPDGFFVAAGAGLRVGARLDPKPHLLDVAPTVLSALGFPVGRDMSGRVLAEMFESPWEPRRVDYGPYEPEWPAGTADLAGSGALDSKLDELKRLGYVDG